jgi:hydrogenase small subunit
MTPFYNRLPNIAGVGVEHTADILGAALAVGAVAGVSAHAAATGLYQIRARRARERAGVTAPADAYPAARASSTPTKSEEK